MATLRDFNALVKKAAFDYGDLMGRGGTDRFAAYPGASGFNDSKYGLTTSQGTTTYTTTPTATSEPTNLHSQVYTNNTPNATSATFTYTAQTQTVVTVTLQEGLEISDESKVDLDLFGIVTGEEKLTIKTSLSSTQTRTSQRTTTTQVVQTVQEPANSSTRATLSSERVTFAGTANVPITITGNVAIHLKQGFGPQKFTNFYVPIGNLLMQTSNLPAWLKMKGPNQVIFTAVYAVSGSAGQNLSLTLMSVPISGALLAKEAPEQHFQIPLGNDAEEAEADDADAAA